MPAEAPGAAFLGVDGGGTKTAFCLIDGAGTVLAEAETGTSAFLSVGFAEVERVLAAGIAEICGKAGFSRDEIARAFFGLPAYGEVPDAILRLDALAARALGHGRLSCDNDMVAGWAGSLGLADGINVIGGTGSMTYGERRGRGLRCGGWGEIVGDEGSGFWIGREALRLFSRMSDGRLSRTPLYDRLRSHLGLRADLELVDIVHNRWQGGRTAIAALARLVGQAAAEGDETAEGLFRDAASELALLVATTRAGLGFAADERVPVSWSGGLFSAGSPLPALFAARLEADPRPYRLVAPLHSPAFGAALNARRAFEKETNPFDG
ncbi:N-acetylglucosamine kinase [Aureimonas endophytica]|uniref:N-acetylglucosamine kinase n=1 Tax=Aureimonas endophytica TaxID=2027858 RepID=A0A917A1T0_9HYPH|nr:BadF/BadG/BcrA/BcrD ATPase family protein [Aureimonas endophytica]GGE22617.1 N-acetylglucosamine kinase [Aureimonas endophytica]